IKMFNLSMTELSMPARIDCRLSISDEADRIADHLLTPAPSLVPVSGRVAAQGGSRKGRNRQSINAPLLGTPIDRFRLLPAAFHLG
ncbi:unnamed protein product, partial [Nesidiocoris tenuis]